MQNTISDKDGIDKILSELLVHMLKIKAITPDQALQIRTTLGNAIYNAGGINKDDKEFIPKLKQGIMTTLSAMHQPPEGVPAINPANQPAINKTLTLLFSDQKRLTPKQQQQLNLGAAYILAMKQNPEFKPNMALIFKDNKSPAEQKEFMDDLKSLAAVLNKASGNKLDAKELNELLKVIEKELKTPGSTNKNDMDHDRSLDNSIAMLEGKMGSVYPIMQNAFGITARGPAYSLTPLNLLSGTILDSRQAATGVESLAAARDQELGEDHFAIAVMVAHPDQDVEVQPEPDLFSALEDGLKDMMKYFDNEPAPAIDNPASEKTQSNNGAKNEATTNNDEPTASSDVEPERAPRTPFSTRPKPPGMPT